MPQISQAGKLVDILAQEGVKGVQEARILETINNPKPLSVFDRAFNHTVNLEGGAKVDDTIEGVRSKFGVRQSTLDAMRSKIAGLPGVVDQLTLPQARMIAKAEYYDRPKLNMLPTEDLQMAVFDAGYQLGPERAIKLLQNIVGSKADGLLGPNTVGAINDMIGAVGEQGVIGMFLDARESFMEGLDNFKLQEKGLRNRIDRNRERFLR